jgi:hypothetical protein
MGVRLNNGGLASTAVSPGPNVNVNHIAGAFVKASQKRRRPPGVSDFMGRVPPPRPAFQDCNKAPDDQAHELNEVPKKLLLHGPVYSFGLRTEVCEPLLCIVNVLFFS